MFSKKTRCYTDSCTDCDLVFKADTERILATNIKRHKKDHCFAFKGLFFCQLFYVLIDVYNISIRNF